MALDPDSGPKKKNPKRPTFGSRTPPPAYQPAVGMGGYQGSSGWTWADVWNFLNQQATAGGYGTAAGGYYPGQYGYSTDYGNLFGGVPATGRSSTNTPYSPFNPAYNPATSTPAAYVTGYGPVYNNPYYNPGFSAPVVTPNSYYANSMAPANRQTPAPGDQATLGGPAWGGWGQAAQDMWRGMRESLNDYGLTEGQQEAGYIPGESERNQFGQPLGTLAPLRTRYRRYHPGARQAIVNGGGYRVPVGTGGFFAGGRQPPTDRKPKKGKNAGTGVTGAYTGGVASFNV